MVHSRAYFWASQVPLGIVKARLQARPAVPMLCDCSARVQILLPKYVERILPKIVALGLYLSVPVSDGEDWGRVPQICTQGLSHL